MSEDIKMSEVFNLPLTDKFYCIQEVDGRFIADLESNEMDEAVVFAVNNHDTLTQQVSELRAALLSIKNRQQVLTPSGFEFSGVWQIANTALKESEL